MNFQDFLTVAQTPAWWKERVTTIFSSAEFPASFFSLMLTHLKTKNVLPAPYQRLNLEITEKRELQATLYQAPLGMNSFFWLGNLNTLKDSKNLHLKLTSYQGPHHIAYFIETSTQSAKLNEQSISIPLMLDFMQFQYLADFLGIILDVKKKTIVKRLFTNTNGLNIETCCMLMHYLELMSSRTIDACVPFLANVVGNSPMLSSLSEHFFSQQPTRFFPVWSTLEPEYPAIFWITFWTEQIWRAYHVIQLLQKKEFAAAKRMSIRLPYSFINRDWQKCDTKTLARSLEFLYSMDYAFKTGSTFCSLDLFYVNYFTGSLKEA